MRLSDYVKRLAGIAAAIYGWGGALTELDAARRRRLARYADRIADTLARAVQALAALDVTGIDPATAAAAARTVVREFGRIEGYVETIVRALRHHLDGRKLNGVKRRLEQLGPALMDEPPGARVRRHQIDRLAAAEGYFRALADSLRT